MECVGDQTRADAALERLRAGTPLLYRGDERNARQLLAALQRRVGSRLDRPGRCAAERFHELRAARRETQRLLARLFVELAPGYRLVLGHASDVAPACVAAWGPSGEQSRLVPLRELLGVVGAFEWQRRGIAVPGLGGRIHPHYGVFAPTRPAYVELLAEAIDPAGRRVFDLGTGTGVLALLAAARGAREVVATDVDPCAVRCARENAERLGLAARVRVELRDLYPEGQADLVLANPPWIPGEPHTPLERAVYDPDDAFLEGFLAGLAAHLGPGGSGWLLLSDLPERLGLRPGDFLETRARTHGLEIHTRRDRPPGGRGPDPRDPLHAERAAERIRLFGLRPAAIR
jgi:SAM-dependent methyltransferase